MMQKNLIGADSVTGSESPNLTSRTDESNQTTSLDVNVDSSSVCSIPEDCQDEFCTQYSGDSDFESVKNVELCDSVSDKDKSVAHSRSIQDELIEACSKEIVENANAEVDILTETDVNEPKILRNLIGKFSEVNGKLVRGTSLAKDFTDSDSSVYESFYSLDNACVATPVIGRIKKTLTWTPRILSEERFLNSRSTTLSSKSSFYTAETYGTFYSARSFQLDSCDFVTCEDFQKLNEINVEQKSKLSKAKDALVRGRDFVKSKFDCYRKRLPGLGAVNSNNNGSKKSRNLCHKTCGFSCVSQGSKEISQYSLPDLQTDTKGDNPGQNSSEFNGNDNGGQQQQQQLPQPNDDDDNVVVISGVMAITMKKNGHNDDNSDAENVGVNFNEKTCSQRKNIAKSEGSYSDVKPSAGNPGTNHGSKITEDSISRETTDDVDDEFPLDGGTMTQKMKESKDLGSVDDARAKKRLRWVSAIEKTGASFASNSRALPRLTACVDQLLYQREMDPELLLSSLGFGGTYLGDDSLTRIPERFLPKQPASPGTSPYHMTGNYPEFPQPLPVMGTSQLLHGNHPVQEPVYEENNENDIEEKTASQSTQNKSKTGTMHRPTFSALAQGVKFVNSSQVHEAPPSPDEETKRISAIPSILDFPNRRALALQGFYGDAYLKDLKSKDDKGPMSRSLSAAEKRRKFVHSAKSRGNWSLTDENEDEEQPDASRDSWDQGLRLKSFSDRLSSDSSLESNDSFPNDDMSVVRNKSIKNLRKQYEETIRLSMDGDRGPDLSEDSDESYENGGNKTISEIRKKQVSRLMSSVEDDGDYIVTETKRKVIPDSLDPKTILMQAQKSTQSTITGSPNTPLDLGFSFEQTMNDGEREFDFKSDKLSHTGHQSVSIVIEEDLEQLESSSSGEVIQKSQNATDLNTLSLGLRSDSCNTLVPVDQSNDSENTEGELTPRSGNISPGYAHEKALSLDQSELKSKNLKKRAGTDDVPRSRSCDERTGLKQLPHSGQESFELEEVSSGEAVYEDFQQTNKPLLHKGYLEKSVSIQSDSSGFADLDPAGEVIQSDDSPELKSVPTVARQPTKGNLYVCKRKTEVESNEENIKPTLTAITYSKTDEVVDKSVVFTVNVPIQDVVDKQSVKPLTNKPRFISKVDLNIEAVSKDKQRHDQSVAKVTPVGDVSYFKVGPNGDIDLVSDLDLDSEVESINDLNKLDESRKNNLSGIDPLVKTGDMKNKVREKIRAKEHLVAASNSTADWLLDSNKCLGGNHSSNNPSRPVWASTPNLKSMKIMSDDPCTKRRVRQDGTHSLDLLLDEELESSVGSEMRRGVQKRNQPVTHHSMDAFDRRQNFQGSGANSEYSSIDESLDQQSMIGSSCGVPEDHLNYLRLARLINGPSLMMDISKMPNSKFAPNFHMKNWMQLPKRKHLEEETLLMQHAVQRYKTELCLMENMLFTLYRSAHEDLSLEERSEVEELQHLWCEVRKEVIKMEELLSDRLKSVMRGNDSYSPLDALEIVQQMIDLLREQLYHQQMCIGRDLSIQDDDDDDDLENTRSPSAGSTSVSESWMSEISNQMSEIKSSLSESQMSQKQELQNRISELKSGLLSDVRKEIEETQNTEMLKLQLQARENEVKKLRMEILLQNVSLGKTRKKQVFESDV